MDQGSAQPIEDVTVEAAQPQRGFYTKNKVLELTTFSISTLRRYMAVGRFPKPVILSDHKHVWRKSEVDPWLDNPSPM